MDEAASMFSEAIDSGISPMEFVNNTKKEGKLIMGIGHRYTNTNLYKHSNGSDQQIQGEESEQP